MIYGRALTINIECFPQLLSVANFPVKITNLGVEGSAFAVIFEETGGVASSDWFGLCNKAKSGRKNGYSL